MSLRTPLLDLLADLNGILSDLAKTIESYNVSESRQREEEARIESQTEVRLPVEITKYYETEQRERPKTAKRENKKLCIEIVGIIIAGVLAALTAATLLIYAFQLVQMRRATKATEQAAYAACVSAQISQRGLLETQRTNSFSQTMASASTMQAAAEIDTEKSYITFDARLPTSEELFSNDPNFYIVYSVKNDGKSAANHVHIRAKAILVLNDEILKVNDGKFPVDLQANYVPAGISYPGTPEKGKPITPLIEVLDSKGSGVTKDSEVVQKVFHDAAIIAVFGNITYSDFAGTHEARFCAPLSAMQPGTMRKGGSRQNEKICANYNQRQDHYTFTAKPPLVTSQASLPSITCTAPPN